ncbi:MAG: proline dehydrogenase family protein [Nitrospiraceae bacterium]
MSSDLSLLEPQIRRIGEFLAKRSAGLSPTIFDSRWWSQTLINTAMKDEAFKAQLFRFIDVLPSLKSDERVVDLVEEYLGGTGTQLFGLQWGLKALSVTKLGARLSGKSIRHQVEQMARTFIAGATIDEALPVLARLWQEGRACSVDLLGEASVSEREADQYRGRCLAALQQLGAAAKSWPSAPRLERDHLGLLPRVQLSIKISALYSQLDPIDPEGSYRAIAARIRPLLDLAYSMPASIIFDMEQAETKDLILSIFMRLLSEDAYKSYPHAGLAVQAYMKDTQADIEKLLQWVRARGAPVTIRLVKGAYWDSDTIRYQQRGWPVPLFERKAQTDAQYEQLTRMLLGQTDLIRPAFGTHNLRSLAHVEAVADSRTLSPDTWEFQMIFGMAEPFQAAVSKMGRRLRIYTPVGELLPGMAYLVRRLLENTSNESFLRKEYVESQSLDRLLAAPEPNEDGPSPSHERKWPAWEPARAFRNEPASDFSQAPVRTAMMAAIAAVKGKLGQTFSTSRPNGMALSGPESASHNPSMPTEVVGRVRGCAVSDVPVMACAALGAFDAWRSRGPVERAGILRIASRLMRGRRYELAAWEIFETGKPWREADADVAEAIDFLEFYAHEMERLGSPRRLGLQPGEFNQLIHGPRGLAVVIAPWNFPLAIPTGMVSAALVTGNVVLFKPSDRSPVMGHHLVDLLHEAGVPPEVLQCAQGGPEIGQALVDHPDVSTIAFTGSKDVGLHILNRATQITPNQQFPKRVIAEMGGKNAIIVDDTADLDEAVVGIVASFTGYQGQKCSACSRAIVHTAVYDLFLQRLIDAVLSLQIGHPEDPGTRMGPLIDARAKAKVLRYLDIGAQEGRMMIQRQVEGPGYFVGPTVFADILPEHRLAQEEIFGPVLAVMRARTFDEALQFANASSYALTGGVYSRSPVHIEAARARFDVGNLYINRSITGALVGRQPFGGHRLSGVGAKAGGEEYLAQFMIARVISENTLRRGFAPAE